MKKLMENTKYYSSILGILFLAFSLHSCSDDDDSLPDGPEPLAEITAADQIISQNTIVVEEVTVDSTAWVIVQKVNEDDTFTDSIAAPVLIEEGTHNDISIVLDSDEVTLEDGANLILQLYADDGDEAFDPELDQPIEDEMDGIVSEEITVSAPTFTFSDQSVVDSTLTFETVSTVQPGFLVLHAANEDGTINEEEILGLSYVEAGETADVVVPFNEDIDYAVGDTVFARLYADDPADEEFTFVEDPATDVPVFFGFEEDPYIYDSIVITE